MNTVEALGRISLLEVRRPLETTDPRGGQPLHIPVEPRIRVWYNSDLKSKNFIVPGLIAVTMMIIAAMLSSLTIAREWENERRVNARSASFDRLRASYTVVIEAKKPPSLAAR